MFAELAQNCNVQRSKLAQNDLCASFVRRSVARFDEVKENTAHDREGYN
jgi:hypothetical protein